MQKTLITIDTNTRAQIDQTGAFINRVANYVNVERGQWQILCFQFYNRTVSSAGAVTLEAYALPAGTSFALLGDNDFNDEDSLMFKSLQSLTEFDESNPDSNMVNIAGDWVDGSTADFALGQISFRINTDTVKFRTVMGVSEVQKSSGLYANLKMYQAGISNPSTIAWFPFVAKNTVRDWSSAQVIPPTGTEAISFINAFLRNPLERRWTSDELTWYTSQGSNTLYQERIANIGADWGPTVSPVAYKVPEAVQGNFVAFDSSGNIADSGIGVSADGTFAAESDELVPTQKAVKTALDLKANLTSATFIGAVTIDGTALTPATQPTTSEKAAMTAANSPGGSNAFATVADIPAAGVDGGFAPLSGGKIPSQYLNANASTHVVATIAARDAITPTQVGERAFVTDATGDETVTSGAAEYIWDGSAWFKIAEAESLDLILDWGNVQNKPSEFPPESHGHDAATSEAAGFMSAVDKNKLNSMMIVSADRLLPESPESGDIAIFKKRGNGSECRFLLQPLDSSGAIEDTAAGNDTPVMIENHGLTVDSDGFVVVTGTTYARVPANTFPEDILDQTYEWSIDVDFKIPIIPTDATYFFGTYGLTLCINPNTTPNLRILTSGDLPVGEYTAGEIARVTIERYYDTNTDTWKKAYYLNGMLGYVENGGTRNYRADDFLIGQSTDNGLNWLLKNIRIRNFAPYRGTSFVPDAAPFLPDAWSLRNTSNWSTLTYAASVTLDSANGTHQKITCTDSLNIIPPVLSSNDPYLRLEVITGGYTISISSSEIVSSGAPATYLLDWYWDGSATMRHAPQEVFE